MWWNKAYKHSVDHQWHLGRSIPFYCNKKGMVRPKQKRVWFDQDVIDSLHCILFFWYLRSRILEKAWILRLKALKTIKCQGKQNLISMYQVHCTSISSNHEFSWNGRFKFQTRWSMSILNSLICFVFHRIQNQNFCWLLCFPNIPPFHLEVNTNFILGIIIVLSSSFH